MTARRTVGMVAALVAALVAGSIIGAPPSEASERPAWAECWDGVRADGGDARAGRIHRLYSAYFLREPDDSGMAYWVDLNRRQVSIHNISAEFARSREFVSAYGALSDAEFVDLVYRNVLGRAADAAGRAHWLGVLQRRALSRGGVMLSFAESAEYIRATNTTRPTERCARPAPRSGAFLTEIGQSTRRLPGMERGGVPGLAGARVHFDTPTAFSATWTRDAFRRPVDTECQLLWVCDSGVWSAAQDHLAVLHDELLLQLQGGWYGATGMPTDVYGDILGPTRRVSMSIYDDGPHPVWRFVVEILDPDTIHAQMWVVHPGEDRSFRWGM